MKPLILLFILIISSTMGFGYSTFFDKPEEAFIMGGILPPPSIGGTGGGINSGAWVVSTQEPYQALPRAQVSMPAMPRDAVPASILVILFIAIVVLFEKNNNRRQPPEYYDETQQR